LNTESRASTDARTFILDSHDQTRRHRSRSDGNQAAVGENDTAFSNSFRIRAPAARLPHHHPPAAHLVVEPETYVAIDAALGALSNQPLNHCRHVDFLELARLKLRVERELRRCR